MAYDEESAARVRRRMSRRRGLTEKAMFGGIGFLLDGNMCVGVWKESLVFRVGKDAYAAALEEPFVREFDITGRAMTGWVVVDPPGFANDDDLKRWIALAVDFTRSLPSK